ncbi:ComEA family DNA-binding protein [Chitinophaga solisilvae]|uniref:ComEA family DNA-binding protein n=1 Tax=Chitinophaga solisilvae TaxID=1233460 RepID=UPI001371066A|nr:helix-hairpin-helix domain-containing protein [Chitinophaga solisilvae]
MWKAPVKEWWRFSPRERIGILVMVALMLMTAWLPDMLFPLQRVTVGDSTALHAAVTAFEAQRKPDAPAVTAGRREEVAVSTGALFYFDPNTLPVSGWEQLGVPARTAATIQRFREKGGRFREAADLQRIYGLTAATCTRLIPYVKIAAAGRPYHRTRYTDTVYHSGYQSAYKRTERSGGPPRKLPAVIDINTADTIAWQLLPGIGPGYARRITAFRDKLGGFFAISQVGECYGLPDSTFQKIQPFLKIGDGSLKKIDLNLTDEKSLAAHPYIRYKLARLIVQYRSAHAGFRRVDELRSLPLVDEIIYRKIEPYIVITF